jgi:hypothetical protein
MGGACSIYGRNDNMKRRDHLEDLDEDRRIILEWILEK